MRKGAAAACWDTMGTVFATYLYVGANAKVLPPNGLNIRKEADKDADRVGGLARGAVVTITRGPVGADEMVWWQVKLAGSSQPAGWVSEQSGKLSSGQEWYLAPCPWNSGSHTPPDLPRRPGPARRRRFLDRDRPRGALNSGRRPI